MDLTLTSQNEYNRIADTYMTSEEAFEYMSNTLPWRSFGEVLVRFADTANLKKKLTDALCEYSPRMSRDSISRKVRGWIAGQYKPSDRETYFQLCFALRLSEENAQEFLSYCTNGGFHCRDPRELTYAFALRIGMSYPDAVSLYDSLPKLPEHPNEEPVYTSELLTEFNGITSVDEFLRFYMDNIGKLGSLHNTAYKYFTTFIKCLKSPDDDINPNGSSEISYDRLMQKYIRMDVPSNAVLGNYTYVQKMIKKYWPSATNIKNMMNRKEDVSRKVLILLYLITEGIAPDVKYDFVYNDELSPAERFGEHYERLRIMLVDCGMSPPDPRNVFDWAALYAVKMNSSDEIHGEMKALIESIFEEKRG